MNMEDAVLFLSKQISNVEKIQDELLVEIKRVERNYLADKNEMSSKLEQVLNKMSDIENMKFTVQTNKDDVHKINEELSRIQSKWFETFTTTILPYNNSLYFFWNRRLILNNL